jgi:ATP-binding cassette subfamily B protein
MGGDARALKAKNAEAPKIENLGRRILGLFAGHKPAITVTIVLVLIAAALSVIPPLLTVQVFDIGLFGSTGPNLPVLAELVAAMIGLFVVSTLLGVWQTYLTARVGNSVMGALRVRLFTHLQAMELSFFTRTKTGIIQSRLQNDVGGVAGVLTNTISSILGNTVTLIAAVVAMLILSWQLTLVALILMPILVVAQRRVGQVRARIATKTQESLSDMTAITQETLSVSGILLSKSFNRQPTEIGRYADENANQVRLQVSQQMSGQWFFALVSVFLSSIPAIVYLVAGWLILGGDAAISAGTIVAFTTVQARLLFPLLGLMRVALDLQTSGALFARIFEYLDLVPSIGDAPDARELAARPPAGSGQRPAGSESRETNAEARAASDTAAADTAAAEAVAPSRAAAAPALAPSTALGRVEFDNVTFRYPDAAADSTPTLDDVSFVIEPGQFAAFVGPSGAGKTTISYLVPRFYEATGGRVLFADTPVTELTQQSLVEHLGIVSQETYLFHATIGDNLRYAKPDATQEQIEAAALKANIHERVMSFPEGYDTMVGERGYRLSGGEKQRIAIARVLLKDPAVLILDEATSALDTISERIVQTALDAAARGRTTIAIAHRLTTVLGADVIFVLDAGKIVERGTHEELIAAGGIYTELYREQTSASLPAG